jgi:transforming growth factor-beta-induced protein
MRKFTVVLFAVLTVLALALPVVAQEDTIADIVVASAGADEPEFATLLAAVQAADPAVLEALSDPEAELTVFAPTDAAFAALQEALGEEAFGEILADTEMLTGILLFHVLEGVVMSEDVVALLEDNDGAFSVPTLNGQYLDVTMDEEMGIQIDGAPLNMDLIDIETANGVIHVIDAVIVPESRTIAEIVVESAEAEEPEFSTLLTAVTAADPAVLEAISDEEAELTVFAPTDAAFAAAAEALGEEAFNALLEDPEALTNVLLYHVVDGAVYSGDVVMLLEEADMEGMIEVEMFNGDLATVEVTEDGLTIAGATIVVTDIDAGNGVIHVIDAVMLPPSGE